MSNLHGALDHDQSGGCNYAQVLYPQAPSTLCTAQRHGDQIAYDTHHCRCPDAREAHRVSRGRRHLRLLRTGPALVPGIGTARRLQALAAIGYSVDDLAAGLGIRPSYVGQLQHAENRNVRRVTAENVCAFYQQHADWRGPSTHAIPYAVRNDWLAPLWWDDDTIDDPTHDPQEPLEFDPVDTVAVHRFITGDDVVPLNRAEKACAYQEMDRRGIPRNAIARRLRISGTTARELASQETVGASRLLDQENVVAGRCNNSGAEQGCSPTRLQTETPECPGGRPMPSIAAATNDRFAEVAG